MIAQKLFEKVINGTKTPNYYVKKANTYWETGNKKKAGEILNSGLKRYPNNLKIRKQYAVYAMEAKQWNDAIINWKFLLKSQNESETPSIILQLIKALQAENQLDEATNIIQKGITKFPYNNNLKMELIKVYRKQKKYDSIAEMLCKLEFKTLDTCLYFVNSLVQLKMIDQAKFVLFKGLKKFKNQTQLLENSVKFAIKKREWQFALACFSELCKVKNPSYNNLIMLSMLNQIMGNQTVSFNIFDDVLKSFSSEIKEDELGYRKLTLYDNGKTRIEFYKNLKPTKSLVFTFDAAKMRWSEAPFGFKLLQRQPVDIIAVRKKTKKDFHQDLSKDVFNQTVKEVEKGYQDKFSYGYSLGAYSALYYTSDKNCKILALSPRLPIHPIYGIKKDKGKQTLYHNSSHTFNDKSTPIIIYDPKNKVDSKYVEESLLASYPNTQLKKLPYGGHRMTFHLLSMGVLKEYVLTFINEGSVPAYNRKLKSQSPNYCRLLAEACLKHHKIRWANHLSLKALELEPTNKRAIKCRVDVLKRLNRVDEAIKVVEDSVEKAPNNLEMRLIQIDLYLSNKDIHSAEKELARAYKQFKQSSKLIKREERIKTVQENFNS